MASTDDVSRWRAKLERRPPGRDGRDIVFANLARALYERFEKERNINDLNEAITFHHAALELRPLGNDNRALSLGCLAICFSKRYDARRVLNDLEEAIILGRAALELRPLGHPDRAASLYNLACDLGVRFQKQADMRDLEEMIELHRTALELHPSQHPQRSSSLCQLAICLSSRYDNQDTVADLEEAVTLGRAALELRPPGHPGRGGVLHNLACDLRKKFQRQTDIRDLEEAIELLHAALELRPSGLPQRSSSLHQLAICLSGRYDNRGTVTDLEEAVTLGRAALELRPTGHPSRVVSLYNLACDLGTRFKKQADTRDLEEAIELHRAALELHPPGHPQRSSSLHQLSICLSSRYDSRRTVADLEEAVMLGRAALELRPQGHPDRGNCLSSLGTTLRKKFQKQENIVELDEAIELHRAALQLRPAGHPQRPSSLHSLALCLSDRYDNQSVVAGSRETAALGQVAPAFRPPGHPDRGPADLDEAIVLEQEAVQLLTPGDPSYDISRRCLTAYLQVKTRSQVATPPSNTSLAVHFDIKEVIHNIAFETLKASPPRLLHTLTGVLCNRDEQISHFMASQQYNQLLSSCITCNRDERMNLIRTEVSRYFRFATLSHRWGEGEPSLRDIEGRRIYGMSGRRGLRKLQAFCAAACELDYLWAWSDTCCIDKGSSAEFQEAIGSMFAWYRHSFLTIVYLSDVPDTGSIWRSEWFRRGWTLQELLASRSVLFYTQTWSLYKNLTSSNHKADAAVLEELERATGIESRFLTNFSPGVNDARSRLQWASLRRTTRPEDIAYSLFGIFNIHLPVLYGESAENALGRLLAELISQSGDISILDWTGEASPFHSCFPAHITSYQKLPLPLLQPAAEEHVTTRLAPRMREEPTSSSLQTLYRSLAKSPLPRFSSHRLALPCISYVATAVLRRRADASAPSYTYKIEASGLKPLEITLPSELENGALQLVRPWHSKLLGPSTQLYSTTEEQLLFTLGRPFNALLLNELPHNEYKRIASSTSIIARPLDSASILQNEVRTLEIV